MLRRTLIAAALLTLLLPGSAWAGRVHSVDDFSVSYVAGPGQTNRVTVTLKNGTVPDPVLVIRDSAGIQASGECRRIDGQQAYCAVQVSSGLDGIRCKRRFDLGDRNDSFTGIVAAPKYSLCAHVLDGPGNDSVVSARMPYDRSLLVTNGPGNDLFRGVNRMFATTGAGVDVIHGTPFGDVLLGGTGNDRLYGADGTDRLTGGPGFDLLVGGPGDDLLDGAPGEVRRG